MFSCIMTDWSFNSRLAEYLSIWSCIVHVILFQNIDTYIFAKKYDIIVYNIFLLLTYSQTRWFILNKIMH